MNSRGKCNQTKCMAFSCKESPSVGADRRVDEEHFRNSEMLTRKGRREEGEETGFGERGGRNSVNRRLIKEKVEEGGGGWGREGYKGKSQPVIRGISWSKCRSRSPCQNCAWKPKCQLWQSLAHGDSIFVLGAGSCIMACLFHLLIYLYSISLFS